MSAPMKREVKLLRWAVAADAFGIEIVPERLRAAVLRVRSHAYTWTANNARAEGRNVPWPEIATRALARLHDDAAAAPPETKP